MMEFIGWVSLALIGGYAVFAATFTAGLWIIKGGLETIAPALIIAAFLACAWVVAVAWLSPATIGWMP